MPLKTVVCDDELPALELMTELLQETGEVTIAASCQSVDEALAVIEAGGIDLAVFDIEMPGKNGVEAFGDLTVEPKPLLIFATAHPDYALEAFAVDAIDYLLKPVDHNRVRKAVEKAMRLRTAIVSAEKEATSDVATQPGTLTVRDVGHTYLVPHDQVIWIEAAGDYSLVHASGRQYAMRTTLRSLEQELPSDRFLRVHRSAIIGVQHVQEVRPLPKGEALVILTGGPEVKVSRSHRDAVRKKIGA